MACKPSEQPFQTLNHWRRHTNMYAAVRVTPPERVEVKRSAKSKSCMPSVTIHKIKRPRASPVHNWPVAKTMQADARGAMKLGRKFGDTLICVRYRLSPDGSQRVTTVELQVDRVAVQKKANPAVSVKIYASETHLVAKAKAKGAWFNAKTRLWRMHQNDVYALGLTGRVAKAQNQD